MASRKRKKVEKYWGNSASPEEPTVVPGTYLYQFVGEYNFSVVSADGKIKDVALPNLREWIGKPTSIMVSEFVTNQKYRVYKGKVDPQFEVLLSVSANKGSK